MNHPLFSNLCFNRPFTPGGTCLSSHLPHPPPGPVSQNFSRGTVVTGEKGSVEPHTGVCGDRWVCSILTILGYKESFSLPLALPYGSSIWLRQNCTFYGDHLRKWLRGSMQRNMKSCFLRATLPHLGHVYLGAVRITRGHPGQSPASIHDVGTAQT